MKLLTDVIRLDAFLAQLRARSNATTPAARALLAAGLPCCSRHRTEALDGIESSAASPTYVDEVRRACWLVAHFATDESRHEAAGGKG